MDDKIKEITERLESAKCDLIFHTRLSKKKRTQARMNKVYQLKCRVSDLEYELQHATDKLKSNI